MKTTYPKTVTDHFLSKENFTLVKESTYGILKTVPQPKPQHIGSYYNTEDYLSHDDSAPGLFAKIYRTVKGINLKHKSKLVKKYQPQTKSVLDIGCGTGDFLAALPNDIDKTGVEVNDKAATLAKKKDLRILSDIEQLTTTYDVITLWHVLEHLYSPKETFKKLYDLLNDKGTLIIALPNYKSYDAQYYRSDWAGYDVPRHLWHYDRSAVQNICDDHGLSIVNILPMHFDAYYVSLLSEQYRKNPFAFLKATLIGTLSNLKAIHTGESSSLIYIIRKKGL